MSNRMLRFLAILLLLFAGCTKRHETPAPAASQQPAEVAPPAGLVAELTVPDPRRLWASLRKLGGSRAEHFTSNFELAFFFAFGLPPRIAGYVRPDTPVVGVVLAAPGQDATLVIGVRTVRGAELVQALTRADGGYRAERDGSLELFVGPPDEPPLGIVDDWLVTSRDAKSLRAAAAYLARTLGPRRAPDAPLTLSVSRGALGGILTQTVKERWASLKTALDAQAREMQKERGRPADFAEPDAVLALGDGAARSLVELLSSSERLTLVLRPEEDRLELVMTLTPRPGGELARSLAALEVGSLEPLLGLPEPVVAVLSRSSDAERAASAENPADALRAVLGPRLSEKDAAPLAGALRSVHRGRGSVTLFGVLAEGGAFVKQEVRDPKELERGIRGLLECCQLSVVSGPLESFVGKVSAPERVATIPGLQGPAMRLRLGKFGPRGAPGELLIQVRDKAAIAVAANDARGSLVALTTTTTAEAATPVVAKLASPRPPAALAVYADISLFLVTSGRTGPAPALGVIGKRGTDALFEVALSTPACEAILERVGSP
jgi:hypothetical protein